MIISHFYHEIDWQLLSEHFIKAKQCHVLDDVLYRLNQLFNQTTPLTKATYSLEVHRFKQSITSFLKNKGGGNSFELFCGVFRGYRAESILSLYGREGGAAIIRGRLKHFVRHINILYQYLYSTFCKIFVNKN